MSDIQVYESKLILIVMQNSVSIHNAFVSGCGIVRKIRETANVFKMGPFLGVEVKRQVIHQTAISR